jgi:hypothetical protein
MQVRWWDTSGQTGWREAVVQEVDSSPLTVKEGRWQGRSHATEAEVLGGEARRG